MSRELLPCPFCGGDANFKTTPESWGYHSGSVEVRCRKCGGSCGSQDDYSARKKAAAAWNTRAPVSVTDEALRIATAKHWRYFNQSSGDAEYCEREAMRVALEAAIPHLSPVSVTNDPRVVEVIEALKECVGDMELTEAHYGQHDGSEDALARARAALANLEKKE